MLSAMECRANSKECRRMARDAAAPSITTAWADMAQTWILLAGQMDRIEDLVKWHRLGQ